MKITIELTNHDLCVSSTSLASLWADLRAVARQTVSEAAVTDNAEIAGKPADKPVEAPKQAKATKTPAKKESAPEKAAEELSEPKKAESAPKDEPKPEPKAEPTEEPKEAPEAETAETIDLESMKKRLMEIKESDKGKWTGIKNLIAEYSEGSDKPMVSKIPEDKRQEFMDKVEAL